MAKVHVFGVGFDDLDVPHAVALAMREEGEARSVFTPNALMLERSFRDPALPGLLNSASLVLPDGAGVLLAARRAGTPLSCRVAGIDFGEELLRSAAKRGKRVFLLGGKDGVAQKAAENLRNRIDGLQICGNYWGYFKRYGVENEQVREFITRAKTDILLVCLGFPLQEEWIRDNLPYLPTVGIAAGLGGSLDVWAGNVPRAPEAFRKARLEWAWRMLRQPSRLTQLPALVRFWGRTVKIKPEILQTAQNPDTAKTIRVENCQK